MGIELMVSTRKGLFTVAGTTAGDAAIHRASFVADNVSLAMADHRDGARYAALNHGHFGVKLHRSDDAGATWSEIASPAFPAEPGVLWCGTIPGGLFRSPDRGATWE